MRVIEGSGLFSLVGCVNKTHPELFDSMVVLICPAFWSLLKATV